MAHGRQEFALVGYSRELERKPLKFVEPIVASRICSACGIVPRQTFMLLCGHTFCKPCYNRCESTSERVCPLDGEACAPADVNSKEYPAEPLLRRKVYCWNKDNGCPVILPASQVAEHVFRDCQHHVTHCPKCTVVVLSRDACAHLKSQCTALVVHAAPGAEPRACDDERTRLMELEKKMEEGVHQLHDKFAQLSLEIASHSDKLCHSNNSLKEALTDQFGTACAEMKAFYSERLESLMTAITPRLTSLPSDSKTHQRVITGYAALKEEAIKDGFSLSMSDNVYLGRYLWSWGILFKKMDDSVYLLFRAQLHEGKEDDFLDWPFTKELRLSIIHPQTRQELLLCGTPNVSGKHRKLYSRPMGASNGAVYFSKSKVNSNDIEGDGYIERDQLLVRVELGL